MTETLFRDDAYLREATATVLSPREKKGRLNRRVRIVLSPS